MFGELNERAISMEKVREAVNEMKSGDAPGLHGFIAACLQEDSMAVLQRQARLLKASFEIWVTAMA